MTKTHKGDGIPAWHRFELMVREALNTCLPGGEYAGFLRNRRLGHEKAAEADLIYAGSKEGKRVMVIVECKNRPIKVSDSTIELPENDSITPKDIMEQLARQAHHARTFLGVEDVFFIVVACMQTSFSRRVTPNVFAVGQPISRWTKPMVEQDFSTLISTWQDVVSGVQALRLDSDDYAKLRDLPRFTPWISPDVDGSPKISEIDGKDCENPNFERDRFDDGYVKDHLRCLESDLEDGWYYDDADNE